jgi:hypothetical protein
MGQKAVHEKKIMVAECAGKAIYFLKDTFHSTQFNKNTGKHTHFVAIES